MAGLVMMSAKSVKSWKEGFPIVVWHETPKIKWVIAEISG
jgi:hypothetical protein